MRITTIHPEPFDRLRYLNAGRHGRPENNHLPLHRGRVRGLPAGVRAVLAASDLQGRAPGVARGTTRPLGVGLVERYLSLYEAARLPRPEDVGVILAGDLYADPASQKRGGFGDVTAVWHAFADHFRWVVGVGGNHDDVTPFPIAPTNAHLLDGTVVDLDGLRFGGVSGIRGREKKPGRKSPKRFVNALEDVLLRSPDVVILHEGPGGRTRDQHGAEDLVKVIDAVPPRLVVTGHVHWKVPLGALPGGATILNVDGRAVLLEEEPDGDETTDPT